MPKIKADLNIGWLHAGCISCEVPGSSAGQACLCASIFRVYGWLQRGDEDHLCAEQSCVCSLVILNGGGKSQWF